MLRRVRTSECSASGPRPSIEMLVVKTAWILSFILSRDEDDEKDDEDEDRATHCSRQALQHREQELRVRGHPDLGRGRRALVSW